MNFADAVERVLEHEGGWVDDPDDEGGETRYGISAASYPDEDIANMTRERARALYRWDYWEKIKVEMLPPGIRGTVFDMAVNAGPSRAVSLLQSALGSLQRAEVSVDGVMGPQTAQAAATVHPETLLHAYTARRADYYLGLGAARPRLRKFQRGWLRRAYSWVAV
jgi:lysozyme family protein